MEGLKVDTSVDGPLYKQNMLAIRGGIPAYQSYMLGEIF